MLGEGRIPTPSGWGVVKSSPTAEMRNIDRIRHSIRFAQKALHRGAVLQHQRTNSQRRGNFSDKSAESGDRQLPNFHLDRATALYLTHQSRLAQSSTRQSVQLVNRAGTAGANQNAFPLD